jgi:hypothetical protein
MATYADFVRRENSDSTIDSICLKCFRTVATNNNDLDRLIAEEGHICDLGELLYKCYLDSLRGTG